MNGLRPEQKFMAEGIIVPPWGHEGCKPYNQRLKLPIFIELATGPSNAIDLPSGLSLPQGPETRLTERI